jgi:hypothetical protein
MRSYLNIAVSAVSIAALAACASTKQQINTGFKGAESNFKVLLMQPDIEVGTLTAGGLVEPNQEWTDKARGGVLNALANNSGKRGGQMLKFTDLSVSPDQDKLNNDLENLHRAVATSIARHKYGAETLPTKKDKFDWTLGSDAKALGTQSSADYALFVYGRDSFASGGRVALQAVGMLGCVVGVCVAVSGGQQFGYASLVDLKSGDVVWFNMLGKGSGDMRTPEGAQAMVDLLLKPMPLGPRPAKKSK